MTDPSDKARIRDLEEQLRQERIHATSLVEVFRVSHAKRSARWLRVVRHFWRRRDMALAREPVGELALEQLARCQAENLRLQRDADDAHMAHAVYRECAAFRALTIRDQAEQLAEAERHLYELQDDLAAALAHAQETLDLALGYAADVAQMGDAGDDLAKTVATLDEQLTEAHRALDDAGIERLADSTTDAEPLSLASRIRNLAYDRDELRAEAKRLREALDVPTHNEDQWWHRLEVGDVFVNGSGGERVVRVVADRVVEFDSPSGLIGGNVSLSDAPYWNDCTPPLHLDPEWFKRAPVGTKLVDTVGDIAVVAKPGQAVWVLVDGKSYDLTHDDYFDLSDQSERVAMYPLRPMSPSELREMDSKPEQRDDKPWHEREEWWKHAPVGAELIGNDGVVLRVASEWKNNFLRCEVLAHGHGDGEYWPPLGERVLINDWGVEINGVRPHIPTEQKGAAE